MASSAAILGAVAAAAPLSAHAAYLEALAGSWTGTLEYRDYRSDRRVTLQTRVVITPSADGLTFDYVYDDGPGKTVKSVERISIAADLTSYRIRNGDGSYDVTFVAQGLREFGKASNIVVLEGKGTENDEPVDVRISIVINTDTFSMLRESRRLGADWRFRNHYQFKRGHPLDATSESLTPTLVAARR